MRFKAFLPHVLLFCWFLGEMVVFKALAYNARAPGFYLRGVDGEMYANGAWSEAKAFLMAFTAPSCIKARPAEALLIKLQSEFGEKGLQVIALNPGDETENPEDGLDSMSAHAREAGFNFPFLRDATQEVARACGAQTVPEAFLFNEQRVLRYSGAVEETPLRAAINAVLDGQEPEVRQTQPSGCQIAWVKIAK